MIDDKDVSSLKKYHSLTNYLSVAMLYLKENFFLKEELQKEHIKKRILGHWGTVPGVNLTYGALNYLIKKYSQQSIFILGPGHGAPGVLSGLWTEGSLYEYYPKATLDEEGAGYLIKNFSWSGGFPSHTYPGLPGSIHEGGELGYSLGTAYGAALNNKDQLVVALVGDGEAETGPLAASWHLNKFLNPKVDGAVLPILHLNGYRISGPTIFGTMSDDEIRDYFFGLGYEPIILDVINSKDQYKETLEVFDEAYQKIQHIKEYWDEGEKTNWPVIILKTKKGYSCPDYCEEVILEDHNNSHGIPIHKPTSTDERFNTLKTWLEGYRINELVEENGRPIEEIREFLAKGELRIGMNKNTIAGEVKKDLILPMLEDHEMRLDSRGTRMESRMFNLGQYLRDVFSLNEPYKNFKLFSPDESESNLLGATFQETSRRYIWPTRERDKNFSYDGDIIEILSEHVLQELFTGYVLTGRHGIFISYEAFFGLIANQVAQFIKFLEQSEAYSWRKEVPSINLVSTSTAWRQEHNGFSHQNPTLINNLLTKKSKYVNIYFPSDVNSLTATTDKCLKSTNCVNLVIACKRPTPQWLRMDEAKKHVDNGLSIWHWVDTSHDDDIPDVVLASAGDYQTVETLAAASMLNELIPEIRIRYVNVNELTSLGLGDNNDPIDSENEFNRYFTEDRDVLFNFHGYKDVIKSLTWGYSLAKRMKLFGYSEEGTTTTPFDMQVLNGTSRYQVAIEAIKSAMKWNKRVLERKTELITYFEELLEKHKSYILEYGDDMPEVKDFKFKF
ncbi:MAG: phosphoketolase family protein [Candidatus Dojkabacteria bacterium]|nr:phosphoketolase family protein [Candidatus Dojkabacteria bacterium]MDQ7021610.1 phosphoketolase family protein [Candidatus Dojkabacteria bacterium]